MRRFIAEAVLECLLQMGKDVVTFLTWAAEPEMEERKLVRLQVVMSFALIKYETIC